MPNQGLGFPASRADSRDVNSDEVNQPLCCSKSDNPPGPKRLKAVGTLLNNQ